MFIRTDIIQRKLREILLRKNEPIYLPEEDVRHDVLVGTVYIQ